MRAWPAWVKRAQESPRASARGRGGLGLCYRGGVNETPPPRGKEKILKEITCRGGGALLSSLLINAEHSAATPASPTLDTGRKAEYRQGIEIVAYTFFV
jgi:hypothetical protein